jgi:hypothetical protein
MACNRCNYTNYEPSKDVWTQQGNLVQNNWSPFDQKDWPRYQENYYNTLANTWTREANITPDNSDAYNAIILKRTPLKEGFNGSTYSRMDQTWTSQNVYTSN